MTILTNTAQDAYNQLLANGSNNLKGTWEITEDNYLSITGNSNGSIAMFSQLGALQDFTLEWTAKQLSSGGYIISNLCPVLRYTPEDFGIEGGGNNWALLTNICSYGNKVGTLTTRTQEGVTQENRGNGTLVAGNTYSFKLIRSNSSYTLYQDDVIICQAPDPEPNTPLYLGWYLWYGGSNATYQTNFVLQSYILDGEVYDGAKNYLNTDGLTKVWEQIGKKYYSKEEVDTSLSAKVSNYLPLNGGVMSGDLRGNGSNNLGTSTNKWKTINGINPGALSLPGNYVNVDSTNWKLDGARSNIILPTTAYTCGYLSIVAICTSSSDYGWVYDEQTRIGNCSTAISDGSGFVVNLLIPITNVNNSILCAFKAQSIYSARFFMCQGNV